MPFDIGAQIEEWRTKLLDTTKRNRLISFKVGRTGGIALVHPDPGEIWDRLVAKNETLGDRPALTHRPVSCFRPDDNVIVS